MTNNPAALSFGIRWRALARLMRQKPDASAYLLMETQNLEVTKH